MRELTLEDLAPYLAYRLKCRTSRHQIVYGEVHDLLVNGLSIDADGELNIEFLYEDDLLFSNRMNKVYPLFRPLSDLTKPITVEGYNDGKGFVPIDILWNETLEQVDSDTYDDHFFNPDLETTWICQENVLLLEWVVVEKLIEWHFDIHSLIDAGLAIDINTLP